MLQTKLIGCKGILQLSTTKSVTVQVVSAYISDNRLCYHVLDEKNVLHDAHTGNLQVYLDGNTPPTKELEVFLIWNNVRTHDGYGNKIKAIKLIRELLGIGLKEAKELVERTNPGENEPVRTPLGRFPEYQLAGITHKAAEFDFLVNFQ